LIFGLALALSYPPLGSEKPDGPRLTAIAPQAGITTPGCKVGVYGSGFSAGAVVYFGGLGARETDFINPSTLEVVTPFLRPGRYKLQLKSGSAIVRSEISFTAVPSQIDGEIDRAVTLAGLGQTPLAVSALSEIRSGSSDYQVRAFAAYQMGQIYFALGDWWRWAGVPIYADSDKAGMAVQTSWRYRLSGDQSAYYLPTGSSLDQILRLADWTVEKDVTENPEPRFFRALVSARFGVLDKAKADVHFILDADPTNASYRALAAYVGALTGDTAPLSSFRGQTISDPRALGLLGEAAYLNGDVTGAQRWWTHAGKAYPLGARLACLAGKKHLALGQKRVAEVLLAECTIMAPSSKEAKEARDLLAALKAPPS